MPRPSPTGRFRQRAQNPLLAAQLTEPLRPAFVPSRQRGRRYGNFHSPAISARADIFRRDLMRNNSRFQLSSFLRKEKRKKKQIFPFSIAFRHSSIARREVLRVEIACCGDISRRSVANPRLRGKSEEGKKKGNEADAAPSLTRTEATTRDGTAQVVTGLEQQITEPSERQTKAGSNATQQTREQRAPEGRERRKAHTRDEPIHENEASFEKNGRPKGWIRAGGQGC